MDGTSPFLISTFHIQERSTLRPQKVVLAKTVERKMKTIKNKEGLYKREKKNFLVMTCFLYCYLAFSSGLISLPRNQIIG